MPAYIFECYSQATYDIEADNETEAWEKFYEEAGDQEWDSVDIECIELAEEEEQP